MLKKKKMSQVRFRKLARRDWISGHNQFHNITSYNFRVEAGELINPYG